MSVAVGDGNLSAAPIPKNPAQHNPAYANILKMKASRPEIIIALVMSIIFLVANKPFAQVCIKWQMYTTGRQSNLEPCEL